MKTYWPLIILILVSLAAADAMTGPRVDWDITRWDWHFWMHNFMGFFLCMFALLKLFDPKGFENGFAMYDLLAKSWHPWGFIYPWVELGLGLAYFAFIFPTAVYIATIVLFSFGAIGVVLALRKGLNINCPCMGNVLKVPLSTVTLTEDIAMIVMAIVMLAGAL